MCALRRWHEVSRCGGLWLWELRLWWFFVSWRIFDEGNCDGEGSDIGGECVLRREELYNDGMLGKEP